MHWWRRNGSTGPQLRFAIHEIKNVVCNIQRKLHCGE